MTVVHLISPSFAIDPVSQPQDCPASIRRHHPAAPWAVTSPQAGGIPDRGSAICEKMAGMALMKDVVFDCEHPASLARFWAEAVDGYEVAPYDEAELARLREIGVEDPEDDPGVLVEPPSPGRPRLYFQKVPEPKSVKNRVHLDLRADDVEAEVKRLVALGAAELHRQGTWVTLRDPEGNEFCIDRS